RRGVGLRAEVEAAGIAARVERGLQRALEVDVLAQVAGRVDVGEVAGEDALANVGAAQCGGERELGVVEELHGCSRWVDRQRSGALEGLGVALQRGLAA